MEYPSTILFRKRREQGICPQCGGERDDPKRNYCSACRAYHRMYNKIRREQQTPAERKAELVKKTAYMTERYRKLRMQGLCGHCGKVKTTKALCEACYAKQKEYAPDGR